MNNPLPELKYVGTCSELGDVYERVHAAPSAALDRLAASSAAAAEADGLNPPTSPRAKREWRATKADLEAQVAMAATALESMAERLEDSRRWASYYAKKAAANWVRGDRWLAVALAGWAAFAVAVVWL